MKKILYSIALFMCCSMLHAQDSCKVINIALTGDIMMGTTYPSVQLPADEGRQLFKDVSPILQEATLALGNLEGTLCDGGRTKKVVGKACYAFRTPTSFAPRLSEAGYDFLSLANNHANDFGTQGLSSTMKCLDEQNISFAGIANVCESAVIEKDGLRYGLCAFGHNSYTLLHTDPAVVKRIVEKLSDTCDIVIVSFHGGAEGRGHTHLPYGKEVFYNENRGSLREFAHLCIDSGADIVYGHGPHVVRAMELYNNHFIVYSLGNFCTPYGISLSGVSGYSPVVTVNINDKGEFIDGQIHPFIQQKGVGPRKDPNNGVIREFRNLTRTDVPDTPLEISDDGKMTVKK